ncbi:MAG: ABC transporter substrate-binding protein [Burkholderiales bacterium]
MFWSEHTRRREALTLALSLGASVCGLAGAARAAPARRVLHVMSYHSDWQWNKDQWRGFEAGLGDASMQARHVALDAKRGSAAQVQHRADEAVALVREWQPHLVYVTDDPALSSVVAALRPLRVPTVLSGINQSLLSHGLADEPLLTGAMEHEHGLATLNLLRALLGRRRLRLAAVIDDDPMWRMVVARLQAEVDKDPELTLSAVIAPRSFEDYKREMAALQGQVDAVGLLGVFRFEAEGGGYADYEQVLRWTAENSRLPDFSFWDTRVERGTLCAVTVDGVEQGRLAGQMARRILLDGVAPSALPARPSSKGRPMVSLERVRALGLRPSAKLLLQARVLPAYAWADGSAP